MKIKFGKMLMHSIIIGLLVAILVLVVQGSRSNFSGGAPLLVNSGPSARQTNGDIFSLRNGVSCVPGSSETADYYTQGLAPGGICGGSAMVRDQLRDYTIAGGIGGSLMEDI
jgi:hypothetical protein